MSANRGVSPNALQGVTPYAFSQAAHLCGAIACSSPEGDTPDVWEAFPCVWWWVAERVHRPRLPMGVAALLLLFAADGHPRWVCIAGCLRTRPLMSGFVASEKDKTISGARVVPHHALVQWWRPADRSVGGAADWSVGQSGGRTVGGRGRRTGGGPGNRTAGRSKGRSVGRNRAAG